MVTLFEDYTFPVNSIEVKTIIPYIVGKIKFNIGEENAAFAKDIISQVNNRGFLKVLKNGKTKAYKISGPRFRQMIHYIRVNSLVPNLIASQKGYYVATTQEEVEKYIKSLEERRNSFEEVRSIMQAYSTKYPIK